MIVGKKVTVVLPAYQAETTLERTYAEIPRDVVDDIILVDDASSDKTVEVAAKLGIHHLVHPKNRGYGANQKTCYREALERGADIIIMVHPDYQYTPKLIPAMAGMVASGFYDVVLGSRILGRGALQGGMPFYKYLSNRCLTAFQNLFLGQKLSEFHSGYRAYSRKVLETLPLMNNAEDYSFDNQMLTQVLYFGFKIGEVSCPTLYHSEMSSINFTKSVKYGLEVLRDTAKYVGAKGFGMKSRLFDLRGGEALLLPAISAAQSPAHGTAI